MEGMHIQPKEIYGAPSLQTGKPGAFPYRTDFTIQDVINNANE
jgi:hypothetical protein